MASMKDPSDCCAVEHGARAPDPLAMVDSPSSKGAGSMDSLAGVDSLSSELDDSFKSTLPGLLETSRIGTINVLVIEDDEQQRVVLGMLFSRANEKNGRSVRFDVTFASLASEALAIVERHEKDFHLILLDLVLPDKHGHELLPELRVHVGPEVAIVIATAHSQTALVQLCVSRGADAFLVKPLGSTEVQHIWQFVKNLPDSSFKKKLPESSSFRQRGEGTPESSSSSFERGEPLPPRSASVCDESVPEVPSCPLTTHSVLSALSGHAAGEAGPAPSGTALGDGEISDWRVTAASAPRSIPGSIGRRVTPSGESQGSASGASSADAEDIPVMADCKQQ